MKNRKTRSAMRRMLFTLALVLVVAVASVGGTIAWLTDKTDPVTNTFTVGDINIKLYETLNPNGEPNADGSNVTNWQAKLIPGSKYAKNPQVSVDAGSEDCYLFVKFEEINNPSTYLTYTSMLTKENSGWTKVSGENDVWYRTVAANASERSWYLLQGEGQTGNYVNGVVTVKENIIKTGTVATDSTVVMPTEAPVLKYTAYAVQQDNLTVEQAWEKVKPSSASGT